MKRRLQCPPRPSPREPRPLHRQPHSPASPSQHRGAGCGCGSSCLAGSGSSGRTCSSAGATWETTGGIERRGRAERGGTDRLGLPTCCPRAALPGPAAPRSAATDCAGGSAARPSPPPPAAAAVLSAAPPPQPPWRPSRRKCRHFRPASTSARQRFRLGVAARRGRHGDRAAAAMAAPPESLLRYCPPVLVSRRADRSSAAVSAQGARRGAPCPTGAERAGGRACRGAPPAPTALSSGVPAGPAHPRRLLRHATAAGDPERHPAAAVSGAGPGPAVPGGPRCLR